MYEVILYFSNGSSNYSVAKENSCYGCISMSSLVGVALIEDERFQWVKKNTYKRRLSTEDDFHASQKIRDCLSCPPYSWKQQKVWWKIVLWKHETIKGSCKIVKL